MDGGSQGQTFALYTHTYAQSEKESKKEKIFCSPPPREAVRQLTQSFNEPKATHDTMERKKERKKDFSILFYLSLFSFLLRFLHFEEKE